MQHLEVSGAVRLIYRSLGVKGLITLLPFAWQKNKHYTISDGSLHICFVYHEELIRCCERRVAFRIRVDPPTPQDLITTLWSRGFTVKLS